MQEGPKAVSYTHLDVYKRQIYIKSLKDVGVIKNLITKVLDEYGYSTDDFVIYLESDFTDLYI